MPRPLRIEYTDAWYHVMSRARKGQDAFPAREDLDAFIELIKETSKIFDMRIAAYCLISTHYHLLIQTPGANLSRCMRHINGVYTQRYNLRNGCDGTLFRGRYKSILVDADTYLLELVRYIHRNPLRAGIVDNLNDYRWSSHQGYISRAKEWMWLHKNYVLDMFSKDKRLQINAYKKFISTEDSAEIMQHYSKMNTPSMLGSDKFIEWVRDRYPKQKKGKEIPESRSFCPEIIDIKKAVCNHYKIAEADLLKSKRGVENEARDLAIYMLRFIRGERLTVIGQEFNLNNYSSVSSAIERIRRKLDSRKFKRHHKKILDSL